MRILITGSRNWTNRRVVLLALKMFAYTTNHDVVHGGAEGADTIAAEVADMLGYRVELPWRPKYKDYPEDRKWQAPLDRNTAMVESKPDVVLAFMLGTPKKGGTLDTVTKAKAANIPVIIFNWPGDPEHKD